MRLEKVNPPEPQFTTTCYQCGKRVPSSHAWADLDGPAFEAYYCEPCLTDNGWTLLNPRKDGGE